MFDITCSMVVYHHTADQIRKPIENFLRLGKKVRLFIIDNSGNDKLRYAFISPQIEYIFSGKNLGYGAGHNLALSRIQGRTKYHIVMNPDIEFETQMLDVLYDFMEREPEIGLVMPKITYPGGAMQYLCKKLPTPADLILRRFIPGPLKKLFRKSLESYELRHRDYQSIMEVPNLSGCFMFLRNEVLETVGHFDETYFLYLEDTDFCRRISASYRTVYYPRVQVTHGYGMASYKNLKMTAHHVVSSFKYFNKWGWWFDAFRENANYHAMYPETQIVRNTDVVLWKRPVVKGSKGKKPLNPQPLRESEVTHRAVRGASGAGKMAVSLINMPLTDLSQSRQ
jgi:GT2 family glycosyltransferase